MLASCLGLLRLKGRGNRNPSFPRYAQETGRQFPSDDLCNSPDGPLILNHPTPVAAANAANG